MCCCCMAQHMLYQAYVSFKNIIGVHFTVCNHLVLLVPSVVFWLLPVFRHAFMQHRGWGYMHFCTKWHHGSCIVCVCLCVCVHVCVHVCVCTCVCVCVYMCVWVSVCVYVYSVCTHMYECVCTCMSIELSGDNILQLIKEVNKTVQNDEDITWYVM